MSSRFVVILLFGLSVASFWDGFSSRCRAEDEKPTHFTYVRRNDSKPGDFKVVTVPAITPRQAKIDAQTYHLGWDAVDAWMGQSRVMYNVLLKKRPPYIPGMQPIVRPIPKEQRNGR